MKNTFKILFWLNTPKIKRDGEVPIYCRITIRGKRVEIPTHCHIKPDKWDKKGKKAKGEKGFGINESLDNLKTKIRNERDRLMLEGKFITADIIKYLLNNPSKGSMGLIEVTDEYIKVITAKIGNGFSNGHHNNYKTTLKYLRLFIEKTMKEREILLVMIEPNFINDFENWVLQNSDCGRNGANKHLQRLKRVIHYAIQNGWLKFDPFIQKTLSFDKVRRGYLTMDEIIVIQKKDYFHCERLQIVKDLFLFSCFTGLCYKDVINLTSKDIEARDSKNWIVGQRGKTKVEYALPVLPPAQSILDKYKTHPLTEVSGRLLPKISNQKLNSYLKEIADTCGIQKNLHYHLARHTFATTICANYGLPPETAQRALGHTKITTTMIYYKLTNEKVNNDWEKLENRFNAKSYEELGNVA